MANIFQCTSTTNGFLFWDSPGGFTETVWDYEVTPTANPYWSSDPGAGWTLHYYDLTNKEWVWATRVFGTGTGSGGFTVREHSGTIYVGGPDGYRSNDYYTYLLSLTDGSVTAEIDDTDGFFFPTSSGPYLCQPNISRIAALSGSSVSWSQDRPGSFEFPGGNDIGKGRDAFDVISDVCYYREMNSAFFTGEVGAISGITTSTWTDLGMVSIYDVDVEGETPIANSGSSCYDVKSQRWFWGFTASGSDFYLVELSPMFDVLNYVLVPYHPSNMKIMPDGSGGCLIGLGAGIVHVVDGEIVSLTPKPSGHTPVGVIGGKTTSVLGGVTVLFPPLYISS